MDQMFQIMQAIAGAGQADCGCGCGAGGPAGNSSQLSLESSHSSTSGFGVSQSASRSAQIDFSEYNVGEQEIDFAKSDLSQMLAILEKSPQDVATLVNAFNQGDVETAGRIAEKVGLTESQLKSNGGNGLGLIVVLAVGFVLIYNERLNEGGELPPPTPDERKVEIENDETREDVSNLLGNG